MPPWRWRCPSCPPPSKAISLPCPVGPDPDQSGDLHPRHLVGQSGHANRSNALSQPSPGAPLVESQADGAYRERRKERKKHDRNRLGSPAEWVAWLPNGQSVMLTASAVSLRSLALSPFPVAVSLSFLNPFSLFSPSVWSVDASPEPCRPTIQRNSGEH